MVDAKIQVYEEEHDQCWELVEIEYFGMADDTYIHIDADTHRVAGRELVERLRFVDAVADSMAVNPCAKKNSMAGGQESTRIALAAAVAAAAAAAVDRQLGRLLEFHRLPSYASRHTEMCENSIRTVCACSQNGHERNQLSLKHLEI